MKYLNSGVNPEHSTSVVRSWGLLFYLSILGFNYLLVWGGGDLFSLSLVSLSVVAIFGVVLVKSTSRPINIYWETTILISWCSLGVMRYPIFENCFPPRKYLLYLTFFALVSVFRYANERDRRLIQRVNYFFAGALSLLLIFSIKQFGYHNVQSGTHLFAHFIPVSLTETCTLISCLMIPVASPLTGWRILLMVAIGSVAAYLAQSLLLGLVVLSLPFAGRLGSLLTPRIMLGIGCFITGLFLLAWGFNFDFSIFNTRWMNLVNTLSYLEGLEVLFGGGEHNFSYYYSRAVEMGEQYSQGGGVADTSYNDLINGYLTGGLVGLVLFFSLLSRMGWGGFSFILLILLISCASYPVEQTLTSVVLASVLGGRIGEKSDTPQSVGPLERRRYPEVVMLALLIGAFGARCCLYQKLHSDADSVNPKFYRYDARSLNHLYFAANRNQDFVRSKEAARLLNNLSKSYESYIFLGDAQVNLNDHQSAMVSYGFAEAINADYSYPPYKMFFCEINLGNMDKAIAICERLAKDSLRSSGMYHWAFMEELRQTVENMDR